jgi:hypothetical protein
VIAEPPFTDRAPQAALAQAIAAHGLADIAALAVTSAKAGGGGNMWIAASGITADVATVDEGTMREAEIWVGRNSVQVQPRFGTAD